MRPSTFCVFKSLGAMKVGLIGPKLNAEGYVEKDGSVLVDATRSTGKPPKGQLPTYDWSQKVVFALGMNDIAKLSGDISVKLVHDNKGAIKTFQLLPGEGEYEGTWRLEMSEKSPEGAYRNVMVPMDAGEFRVFTKLLDRAIPKIIGW